MKQRIDIASSLLSDPTVLLLDEPSTGLDPRGMSEVREIVKSLKTKSRLIFMSSHILSEVAEICDEVAIIDHGKLLVYDTLSNVTARFSGDQNVVEVGWAQPIDTAVLGRTITSLTGVVSVDRIDDRNLRIKFAGGSDIQKRILSDLVRLDIGVVSYKPTASALEDTYLKLITATL
jgi:ABC-2 type transport system ATP-binding protein